MLGANALPTWKPVYTTKLPTNTGLRPTDSDSGPQNSGPTQYPATKMDIVSVATSRLNPKCSMRSGMTPSGADEANVLHHKRVSASKDEKEVKSNCRRTHLTEVQQRSW